MYLVPKTSAGSVKWDEKIETASTAIFAIILKQKFLDVGVTSEKIIVVDDATVELRNRRGEIVESYHACEKEGQGWRVLRHQEGAEVKGKK